MWKRYLAWTIVAVLLVSNMPIMSYASEGADVTWNAQEQAGEEVSHSSSDVLENESIDSEEMQESPNTVSGNSGQGQEEPVSDREESSVEVLPPEQLPMEDSTSSSEDEDVPLEDAVETIQEVVLLGEEETFLSDVSGSGTYLPYEGAKYRLQYEVVDGEIAITGITDYESKSDLGRLVIPVEIEGIAVTTIGDYAFYRCSGFTGDLDIPDSIAAIGDTAFGGCSFDNLSIGMSNIPKRAFDWCEITGTLTLQEGVISIEDRAFEYCNNFEGDLLIPASISSIGDRAFFGCKFGDLIVGMTNIPDNMFNREYSYSNGDTSGAFAGCNFAGKVLLENSVRTIGQNAFAEDEYREYKYSFGELIIPSNVISISNGAFRNCRGITKLIIPSNVISIGNNAFEKCKSISELTVPDGVQKIGENAFYGCINLRDIEIASSVKEIGQDAFNGVWGPMRKFTVCGKETVINDRGLGEYNFIYGYAGSTAEDYAETQGCVFIPIDISPKITEYKVSTTQELLDATGSSYFRGEASYRRIILADGIYEVPQLSLRSSISMTIEAEHPGRAELLSKDGTSPVIYISSCTDINIIGCILGHKTVDDYDGCGEEGYVIHTSNSFDVNIDYCDLYGCGITGIKSSNCEDINLSNCVIRDCMRNITDGSAIGLNISNCVISGNAYDDTYASNYAAMSCSGMTSLENCTFLNNYSKTFKQQEGCEITLVNCSFYNNAWDNQTPRAYGICLNGITWQVDGDVLKIGYPLQLDATTVIQSKRGKVLSYSASSLPWKKYKDLKLDVAEGVQYGQAITTDISGLDIEVIVPMAKEEQEAFVSRLAAKEGITAAEGQKVSVDITIANADQTLSQQDKQTMTKYAADKNYTVGQHMDITMSIQTEGGSRKQVRQLDTPIRLVMEVPERLRQDNRVFSVIRLHNGETFLLRDLDRNPDTVTIETDRFSTYTLVYKEASGVRISGTAVSFGNKTAETHMQLLDDNEKVIAETTVTGIDAAYELTNVEAGSYILRVSKPGHAARNYPVTVKDEEIELDTELWLYGDVNGDGKVNVMDNLAIYNHINGSNLLTGYQFQVGDVEQDNKINVMDNIRIYSHIAGTKPLW